MDFILIHFIEEERRCDYVINKNQIKYIIYNEIGLIHIYFKDTLKTIIGFCSRENYSLLNGFLLEVLSNVPIIKIIECSRYERMKEEGYSLDK